MKKSSLIIIATFSFFSSILLFVSYVYIAPLYDEELIKDINVKSYDKNIKEINLKIELKKNLSNTYCKTNIKMIKDKFQKI